ncbi:Serine/threonine-protein kinase PrkC [Marinomonas spartinae]|uniref:Serine/threonine-protein kinase PrkC n=1 Tax=Marinomonas spartinae TaxID=1792290 RepID=A0A1A8TMZ6_9GAMM|nr:protein kinase [Marinomonas spartinae]SBS35437.1 Serine/threonine-protein kinase PrkC [Marinomonas spartinae]
MKTTFKNTMASFFSSKGYQLEHKIGQGGFGTVYLAIHHNTGQRVAIKSVNLEAHNPRNIQQIERFERECHFVAKLDHPNIVRLLDKGQISPSNVYSIFEYVDGTNLSDYIQQHGALSIEETYPIMLQVLDALVHAHQQGIIHRDIKPSNIMLQQTGAKKNAKLLDFGISTVTINQRSEDFKTITLAQESVGTPSYCAPEQLRGEPATFQSDLYMWGLVFIEALTGSPAISGSSIADLYHQHLSDTPVAIPGLLLSHPLGHILQKALRKSVNERIESAQMLFEELEKITISNLVGKFRPIKPAIQEDMDTLVQRGDDPSHIFKQYIPSTERKQITVLALSLSLKKIHNIPEEQTGLLETIYHSTRQQCIDLAQRYGGFHVASLGDLTLFYFGYPVASDHDSRLAARTSLEIVSTISKLQDYIFEQHQCQYIVKMGIHSGILTQHGNQVPDGFASHQACALAKQARDNSILCSIDTKTILDNYYQFSEQQPSQLDYIELVAERALEAFGFIRGVRNTYPLVGRGKELDTLRTSLDTPSSKTIMHIYGEAGVGKSRLIHEFRRLESTRVQHIFQALPEHQNNALFPILSVIKHLLTSLFNQQQSQGEQLTQLMESGEFLGSKIEITTLLAAWLNIDDIEKCQLSSVELKAQKLLLFEGLAHILNSYQEQMTQYSQSVGHIYIFEDIHWADVTSQEFIVYLSKENGLNNQTDAQKQTIITTSRQPAPSAFDDGKYHCIHLEQLSQTSSQEFINTLFDGTAVAEDVMEVLVTRTDGIPLFIEELVSMLKRRKLVHLNNGLIAFVDHQRIDEIPNSLRESIQNKIDGLIYSKDTLQLAAAIGREFSYNLLATASHFSALQVQNDLSELIDNQLIIQLRHVDGDRYLFKHALVRDTAYDSIEKQNLPERHELIAESILKITGNIDRFIASDLAQHYEKAQQYDKASQYYYQAASEAETTFAVDDAIHLYKQALNTCNTSTNLKKEEKEKHFIKILEGLSESLISDGQHEKARDYLEEKIQLLEKSNQYEKTATSLVSLGKTYEVIHEHDLALINYEIALKSLKKSTNQKKILTSNWWKIWLEIKSAQLYVYYWQGKPNEMKLILDEMEPIIQSSDDQEKIADYYNAHFQFRVRKKRYSLTHEDLYYQKKALKAAKKSHNIYLISYIILAYGLGLILCKNNKKAIIKLNSAIELAKKIKDKVIQLRCYTYLTVAYRLLKNIEIAREHAERSLQLSRELKMDDYEAVAQANLSWTYFAENNNKQSLIHLEQSLAQWDKVATRFEYPLLWLSHLHAIALFGMKIEHNDSTCIDQVAELATMLLGSHQMALPNLITTILSQLSNTSEKDQISTLIEELIKNAKNENLI